MDRVILDRDLVGRIVRGEPVKRLRPLKKPLQMQPGIPYPVRSRPNSPIVCSVKAVISRSSLDLLVAEDAEAAGFTNLDALYAFWREHYGDGPLSKPPIWVASLTLDRIERPRLLARRSQYGYTENASQALSGEPEAVDPVTQARLTDEAKERYEVEHHEEESRRKSRARAARLREAEARARKQEVDVSDVIELALKEIDKRLDDAA